MSLKIGNVLKAIEEGKWIKVPAKAGAFLLQVKQLLPGEQYAYRKKLKAFKDMESGDITDELRKMGAKHITGWKGLLQADNTELAFDLELLKDETFINAIMAMTVKEDDGIEQPLSMWLSSLISKSDRFAGEDENTDFLVNT